MRGLCVGEQQVPYLSLVGYFLWLCGGKTLFVSRVSFFVYVFFFFGWPAAPPNKQQQTNPITHTHTDKRKRRQVFDEKQDDILYIYF